MKIRSILRSDFFFPNQDPNIDPNDDSKDRWIIWHYKYDPERRERRNIAIAAFDNRRAFMKFFKRASADLEVAKSEGRAEGKERISGVMWKAGHRAEINQFRHFRGGPGQLKRMT